MQRAFRCQVFSWVAAAALVTAAPAAAQQKPPTKSPARGRAAAAPTKPGWSQRRGMAWARMDHAAVVLPSGQVLVVGGEGHLAPPAGRASEAPQRRGAIATTELYDPATDTWKPAGTLAAPRQRPTATLLPSGLVLVTGGASQRLVQVDGKYIYEQLASAELYDPARGTWSAAAPMSTGRSGHTATLLPSGQVLVVGSSARIEPGVMGGPSDATAELYDPASNTWTPAGKLATGRASHTATLLPSGQVLVVGGLAKGDTVAATAELFDPATRTWRPAGSPGAPRQRHTATVLGSGQVLVVGTGHFVDMLPSAELFDPAASGWSAAAPLPVNHHWGPMSIRARADHAASRLASGAVLLTGGRSFTELASAVLYDPAQGVWTEAGTLSAPRGGHAQVTLPSGDVLVLGGSRTDEGRVLATVERFTPSQEHRAP